MWSAIAVALPSIQDHFGANIAGVQWVVNSHLLALSSLLLFGGSLGDRLGRKKVFLLGMLIFMVGALLSGFAWSMASLIGFQALQGLGSALMVPQSLAIINACFQEGERGRAIGLWAGISGGIAALGPWLGGWLVETSGWPAVFWMTLPVIVLAFIATARMVPENRDPEAGKLDKLGTLLILLGLLGLAYGLVSGPAEGWAAPLVLIGLIGGMAAVAAFIVVETHKSDPLVPLHILKNPLVSGANACTLLLYFAFNGMVIFTVLNLQQAQGYSPTEAGLGLLPPIVIITFLAAPAGALADRLGPRPQMVGGPLLVAAGIALLATGDVNASYLRNFLPGLATAGVGMALIIAPLTKSALSVQTRFSGSASGVNNAVARIAGFLAVAVVGAIMVSTFAPELKSTIGTSGLTTEEQTQITSQYDRLGGIVIPEDFSEPARVVAETAIRGSFVFSFRRAMGVCAMLAAAASAISLASIHKRQQPELTEMKCRDALNQRGCVL
jgi:EmrB/QacA subfamily drug resistance transporter